jgi:hypothetical protein|nr:hypothetical protein [Aeromonas salmonicida]
MVARLQMTIAKRRLAFIITEKNQTARLLSLSSHYQTKYKASHGGASLG